LSSFALSVLLLSVFYVELLLYSETCQIMVMGILAQFMKNMRV